MATNTTNNTITAPNSKHDTARKWLQRQLRKTASRPKLKTGDEGSGIRRQVSLKRPRTAPASGAGEAAGMAPPVPSVPINIERMAPTPVPQPSSPPPRPDTGVIRNVNAWLDASEGTPSPPLMGGLTYWRTATGAGNSVSTNVQYAIPIVREAEAARPSTARSHQVKTIRRAAKKVQVQMPSLLRARSQRSAAPKQTNRRSASMSLFAVSYENAQQGAPPYLMTRSRSSRRPAVETFPSSALAATNEVQSFDTPLLDQLSIHDRVPPSRGLEYPGSTLERRINAMFRPPTRSADSGRPSTVGASFTREDSMGHLSDAPTYFTGPPPPSYRSPTASILTTSSFGCIDGMNTEQRQLSQQRAAQRRGMKGKLKKLARNFKT